VMAIARFIYVYNAHILHEFTMSQSSHDLYTYFYFLFLNLNIYFGFHCVQVTVEELKAQEEHRRRQMNMLKERAKIDRINKITLKEHCYNQKPVRTPSPTPSTLEPLATNIYLEAMAAANLDFSATSLAESIHIPDLTDSTSRAFPEIKLVACNLESAEDFASTGAGFLMQDNAEDKMDPLLSNYSDVLQVPASLGLEPLPLGPTLVEVPGLFVQFPSGEKVSSPNLSCSCCICIQWKSHLHWFKNNKKFLDKFTQ
jgi:hypothetical protein